MKKTKIFLTFFLSIILILASNNANAGGDITIIIDMTNLDSNYGDSRIVVDSNGNYYTICKDQTDTNNEYEMWRSIDSGLTWTELFDFTQETEGERGLDMCIDSNDRIHIIYSEYFGASYIWYRSYDIDSETLTSDTQLDVDAGGDVFDDFDITVDYNDNVYVVFNNDDDNEITFFKYTYGLSQWGTEQEFYDTYPGNENLRGLSLDSNTIADVYCSFIQQNSTSGNDLMLGRWDASEEDFDIEKIRDLTIDSGERYTDIAIKDNDIHIVYQYNVTDGDIQINYTVGSFGGSWSDEQLYFADGYDQLNPSISVSNDDVIHIVWDGNNAGLGGRDGTIGKRGSYGSWSDLVYYAWDNADSVMYSNIFYQNFPSNLNAQTGIVGVCDNSSEHQLLFFDYGIMLGDYPPSEYQECRSPNSIFLISKIFDEGTNYIYMNETGQFNIRITELAGLGDIYLRIVNATGTEVQTKTWYYDELTFDGNGYFYDTILFAPMLWMDTGLYSIDMTWSSSGWEGTLTPLICPFEVLSSEAEGDWGVKTDKASYDYYAPDNIVDLYVKIPSGLKGRLEVVDSSDPSKVIRSLGDILGISTYYKYNNWWTLDGGNRDKTYIISLFNTTNLSNIEFKDSWTFIVGKGAPVTPPVTEDETNFWIGLGIILVFTFIGIGVATRFNEGETQVAIMLLMSTIGGVVAFYYSLVPNYAPFLIGLLFVGYIISQVYGGNK